MTAQRLSAGVVVARETPDGARLLLLRAYRNWDFPKGVVEAGEEPLAAAVRETEEETGIADLEFVWGREHCDTAPYASNKVARYFVARTRTAAVVLKVNPELGRPEHHEYRWVDLTEAFALTSPRLRPVIAWAAGKIMLAAQLARR
jgi:8-oxo-dGTP pyrophosphatase MutT (NUDIX family)